MLNSSSFLPQQLRGLVPFPFIPGPPIAMFCFITPYSWPTNTYLVLFHLSSFLAHKLLCPFPYLFHSWPTRYPVLYHLLSCLPRNSGTMKLSLCLSIHALHSWLSPTPCSNFICHNFALHPSFETYHQPLTYMHSLEPPPITGQLILFSRSTHLNI